MKVTKSPYEANIAPLLLLLLSGWEEGQAVKWGNVMIIIASMLDVVTLVQFKDTSKCFLISRLLSEVCYGMVCILRLQLHMIILK